MIHLKLVPSPRIGPVVSWLCTRCWAEGPGYEMPEPHASGKCEPRSEWSQRYDPAPESYETARAVAAAAGPSVAELERRARAEARRDAWILAGVLALSAATVLVGALSWAGVLR